MAHHRLLSFAQSQVPTPSYARSGNTLTNEIFCHLRKATKYVDRVIIGGSMGKKTSLTDSFEPDFDLVVFCNNKEPPFAPVIEDFAQILQNTTGIKIIRKNQFLLQIRFKEYSFDICPASNLVRNTHISTRVADVTTRQRIATYEEIAHLSNPIRDGPLYSTSLAETAVQFLTQQSSFVHNVARVAKYWNTKIGGEYFPGRKLMIETVAVYTGRNAEKMKKKFGTALADFFKQMEDLKKAKCICLDFYAESKVPNSLPIVLDPANPYNNLLNEENIDFEFFMRNAKETSSKLKEYLNSSSAGTVEENQICKMFEPVVNVGKCYIL